MQFAIKRLQKVINLKLRPPMLSKFLLLKVIPFYSDILNRMVKCCKLFVKNNLKNDMETTNKTLCLR